MSSNQFCSWFQFHLTTAPTLCPCPYHITGIPRLAWFSIARICIARFFEAAKTFFHSTILYLFYTYKKYDNSAMQIF